MKKLFAALIIIVLIGFFFDFVQLFYFEFQNSKDPAFQKIYLEDKIALKDTLISWDTFKCSPIADGAQEWWVDTIIYTEDNRRMLAIVDVITPNNLSYNYSKWIYGIRSANGFKFYACESTQRLTIIDKTINSKKTISHTGRLVLVNDLYYKFTFMMRKHFWNELFIDNEPGIILMQESNYNDYLKSKHK